MELNACHYGEKVFRALAREISRYHRGTESLAPWASDAQDAIEYLAREYLPSGSGFDSGCQIELDESRADKIVIRCEFHHMNDAGYYDGWTHHRAIVTPSLEWGFNLRITGRDKNGIKEYIGDTMQMHLSQQITKGVEQ